MVGGRHPSIKSSYRNATVDSVIRCWALVCLPTTCLVSVFVALTWLGLSINNGTFKDKNLVVVITYFAALLVLECILLAHVALRRQKSARPLENSCCVNPSTQKTSTVTNGTIGNSEPAPPVSESLDQLQLQPQLEASQAQPAEVVAERSHNPIIHAKKPSSPTNALHPPSLLLSQKVPALCRPYHPSAIPEITRPPTAVAYLQQPIRQVPETTTDLRSSWDLTMANTHASAASQSPGSASLPAALSQAEGPTKPSAEPSTSATAIPQRHAAPSTPVTAALQIGSHTSALSSNAPPGNGSRKFYRATATLNGRAHRQPLSQPHSCAPQQVRPQPQPHGHNSLLEKNLIALAGN